MKVGDLIKVNTAMTANRFHVDATPETLQHGQLGIIVRSFTNADEKYPWEVRFTNGKVFWFEDKELEVLNGSG
tara:strand:+ start:683 stop:901 length:219 start_codon:yes stop_codon:yes gene_type:complete